MQDYVLWAHRGASAVAPENTLAAFFIAASCGASGLEMDVHSSKDGVPVIIHDETLERTTNGSGKVCKMSLRELKKLDAGAWFSPAFIGEQIPALIDVLEAFHGRLRLNLELKDFDSGINVLSMIKDYPGTDCVISSFNYQLLHRLRSLESDLPLAVLFAKGNWRQAVTFAIELKAEAFHPEVAQISRPMISVCNEAGLPVFAWTVDEIKVVKSLLRAGVKGIFSNNPALFNKRFLT